MASKKGFKRPCLARRVRLILFAALAGSVPLAFAAEDSEPAAAVPRAVCQAPAHDFGEQSNLAVVEHEFVIANQGAAILRIGRVSTDCGCTTATLATRDVPPGGSVNLRAALNLWGRIGPQRKTIRVETNDPATPNLTLALSATVRIELATDPSAVLFPDISPTLATNREVRLVAAGPDVRILDASVDSPLFTVSVWDGGDERRGRGMTVRSVPPLPPGYQRAIITVTTSHPSGKPLLIPVGGLVRAPVVVVPTELLLSRSHTAPMGRLAVQPGSAGPCRVLGVELPTPDATADVRDFGSGRYRIEIRGLPATPEMDNRKVLIRTDCPAMPVVAIPIRVTP